MGERYDANDVQKEYPHISRELAEKIAENYNSGKYESKYYKDKDVKYKGTYGQVPD